MKSEKLPGVLKRFVKGDAEAFNAIYESHFYFVYNIGLNAFRDREAAKDFTQEIFIKLYQKRSSIENIDNLEAYLRTVCKNKIIDIIKESVRQKAAHTEASYLSGLADNKFDSVFGEKKLNHVVNSVIEELPDRQRDVFKLAKQEGYSIQYIAEKFNTSEQTVKNQLVKALKYIRGRLAPYLQHTVILLASLLFPR